MKPTHLPTANNRRQRLPRTLNLAARAKSAGRRHAPLVVCSTCVVVLVAITVLVAAELVFPVLKSTAGMGAQPGGFHLVSTNQLLKPWGERVLIKGRPVDLAIDSSGHLIAVLNSEGVLVFESTTGQRLSEIKTQSSSYTGIAFRPGTSEIWSTEAGRAGNDAIAVTPVHPATGTPGATVRLDIRSSHPVPAGIAFSRDGKTVYVVLSRRNTLAIIDADKRAVEREVKVGMAPFGVAVCTKRGRIFVTNRGGRRPAAADSTAPSSGSAIVIDPRTGATASGTVSVVDAKAFAVTEVPVGLAPSGIAISPDESTVAVANSHADSVSLIDTASLARADIELPAVPEGSFGSQPNAAAFSPDGRTLYVACGGNNAIAVLTRSGGRWTRSGAIPTAWYPSAIAVESGGALRIAAIKGLGNTADRKGGFSSRQFEGSLDRVPPQSPSRLWAGDREVRAANAPKFGPAGGVSDVSELGIRHVFLIVKENRTYDQVFGDIEKGNGDPKLVMYGRDVTPNHHALAEKYVLLDNTYASGAISFDGHHWLMQAFVSDYVERAFAGRPRGYPWNLADALTVSPAGFFWQGAPRPVGVRVFGELCLPGRWDPATDTVLDMKGPRSWDALWRAYREGTWQKMVGCKPSVPALTPLISKRYPCETRGLSR